MIHVAYLITSAREMALADGSAHPTGYFAEEAIKPYERFIAAGFDITVITPDGQPPYADPYGLSWFFHYPEEDKDYLASVVRTFARDVDDIRLTLHQNTELGLAAARRVAAAAPGAGTQRGRGAPDRQRSREAGLAPGPAVCRRARRGRLARADPRGDPGRSGRAAGRQRGGWPTSGIGALQAIPGFQQPVALSALSDEETGRVRRGVHARRARADGGPGRQPRRRPAAGRAAIASPRRSRRCATARRCCCRRRNAPTGSGCSTATG